jgi:hypothetical protein
MENEFSYTMYIAILKQWLAQGNRYFMNNPG